MILVPAPQGGRGQTTQASCCSPTLLSESVRKPLHTTAQLRSYKHHCRRQMLPMLTAGSCSVTKSDHVPGF